MGTVTATTATNLSQPEPFIDESYECSQEEQIKEKLLFKMKKAVDKIFRSGCTKERKEAIEKHCLKMDTDDFLDGTLAYEVEKLGCVKKVASAATNVLLRELKQEQIQYKSYFSYLERKSVLKCVFTLKDIRFPCNEFISESFIERALSIQKQMQFSSDWLYVLLNDCVPSQEFNQIIRSLSSSAFMRVLQKTHQKAQKGDGVAVRNFCLFCVNRYEYERHDFREVVTVEKAEECVRDCFRNPPNCFHRFIEDMVHVVGLKSYLFLFQLVSTSEFYHKLTEALHFSSFKEWPGKRKVIADLLNERLGYRSHWIEVLLKSEDTETAVLGKALSEALDPNMNPRDRGAIFNTIKENLPDLNGYQFKSFFGFFHTYEHFGFDDLRHELVCKVNNIVVKRTIDITHNGDTLRVEKVENKKKLLVWEIRFDQLFQGQQVPWCNGSSDLYMSGSSFGVVLIRAGDQSLYHLDLETGSLLHKITLPVLPISKERSEKYTSPRLELTNSGFCYYRAIVRGKEILFGGFLKEGNWQECRVPLLPSPRYFEPWDSYRFT